MSPGPCSRSSPRSGAPLGESCLRSHRFKSAPGASALEQWAAQVHPFEFPLVAEFLVDAAHRCVTEVVLRAQVTEPRFLCSGDLRVLQRERDAAPAVAARDAGHCVLARVVGVLVEERVTDDATSIERDE